MKALTVWQPWAWAIGSGMKLVENRDWTPSWKALGVGEDFAIHAGQHQPTRDELWAVRDAARKVGRESEVPSLMSNELSLELGRGRIVAVVTFDGWVKSSDELEESQRPWFVGKFGWRLKNVRQLNLGSAPRCPGAQGLWELPGEVERLVRAQLFQPAGDVWRRTA